MSGMTIASDQIKGDLLTQAISLSQALLSNILVEIKQLDPYSAVTEVRWNAHFSQITQDIGQFVELTSLSTRLIAKHTKVDLPIIKESHIHLLFIMKAINQAVVKQDHLALDDLIKYELKDNLTQWKIDLIPQMKRLINL